MHRMFTNSGAVCAGAAMALALALGFVPSESFAAEAPKFKVAPDWPKPLPDNWLIGQVGGIAVDQDDNIWIIQRQRTLTSDEAGALDEFDDDGNEILDPDGNPVNELGQARPAGALSECCLPAPAVMQFDPEGNLLQAWGGPADPGFLGDGGRCDPAEGCQWPAGEHGIYVDHNDFVYIGGNGTGNGTIGGNPALWAATHGTDSMVLKFSNDGTFIYQIGDPGQSFPVSNDTNGAANGTPQVYRPADMEVDPETNELYIADGYGNHRVLVVDAATGKYVGHWGAYGQNPVDDAAADAVGPYSDDRDAETIPVNFRNPVHCSRITNDGLVYVCDRVNDRIQVFDKNVVGAVCTNSTQAVGLCGYLGEKFIKAQTLGPGSVWDLDTSADRKQSCLHNADGSNQQVDTLHRPSLELLASFGRGGRSAGQFHWVHNLATDSKGNIYTAEVDTGKRAQKFLRTGSLGCRQ